MTVDLGEEISLIAERCGENPHDAKAVALLCQFADRVVQQRFSANFAGQVVDALLFRHALKFDSEDVRAMLLEKFCAITDSAASRLDWSDRRKAEFAASLRMTFSDIEANNSGDPSGQKSPLEVDRRFVDAVADLNRKLIRNRSKDADRTSVVRLLPRATQG